MLWLLIPLSLAMPPQTHYSSCRYDTNGNLTCGLEYDVVEVPSFPLPKLFSGDKAKDNCLDLAAQYGDHQAVCVKAYGWTKTEGTPAKWEKAE